jgi:hypothetical protein
MLVAGSIPVQVQAHMSDSKMRRQKGMRVPLSQLSLLIGFSEICNSHEYVRVYAN